MLCHRCRRGNLFTEAETLPNAGYSVDTPLRKKSFCLFPAASAQCPEWAALGLYNRRDTSTTEQSQGPRDARLPAAHEDCWGFLAPHLICCPVFRIHQCVCRRHWLHFSLGFIVDALCGGVSQFFLHLAALP